MNKFHAISLLLIVTLSRTINAQNVGFSYQAVALDKSKAEGFGRDTAGEVLSSRDIDVRFSITEGNIEGSTVYKELHMTTTDIFGMFRLIVGRGEGIMTANLDDLNWGDAPYFLHVEISLDGSLEYMGAEELLGSPYALNVKDQTLTINENVISISGGNSIILIDNDEQNEIQDLVLNGNNLTITNNGSATPIDLSGYLDNTDTQLTEA
jgi:hypothetical protein